MGGRKEQLYHLQNTITNSIEMEEDGIYAMQEKYDLYKEDNIKFLHFNQETLWNRPTLRRLHLNSHIYLHIYPS